MTIKTALMKNGTSTVELRNFDIRSLHREIDRHEQTGYELVYIAINGEIV